MEGSSLTTSLRYQALLSCFLFFFCNQLAFARLVIRRAVEMESLQFVGCSWFIGLIGLVSDSPEIKATENRTCVHPCSSPVSSRPHLDAPGVHSVASNSPKKLSAAIASLNYRNRFSSKFSDPGYKATLEGFGRSVGRAVWRSYPAAAKTSSMHRAGASIC